MDVPSSHQILLLHILSLKYLRRWATILVSAGVEEEKDHSRAIAKAFAEMPSYSLAQSITTKNALPLFRSRSKK
jgi:hypothetical protein